MNMEQESNKTESQRIEETLSPANRNLVRKYITNCNESLYATLLLSAFDASRGQPLSNAFYLHELEELEIFKAKGYDFAHVESGEEFRKLRTEIYDKDKEPHLAATLSHCKYLQLKAKEAGCELSLGAIIEYDPISSRVDKNTLFQKDPTLEIKKEEKGKASQFFTTLALEEKNIFLQPFSMGNSEVYAKTVLKLNRKETL